jgi:hypothetical protein
MEEVSVAFPHVKLVPGNLLLGTAVEVDMAVCKCNSRLTLDRYKNGFTWRNIRRNKKTIWSLAISEEWKAILISCTYDGEYVAGSGDFANVSDAHSDAQTPSYDTGPFILCCLARPCSLFSLAKEFWETSIRSTRPTTLLLTLAHSFPFPLSFTACLRAKFGYQITHSEHSPSFC